MAGLMQINLYIYWIYIKFDQIFYLLFYLRNCSQSSNAA